MKRPKPLKKISFKGRLESETFKRLAREKKYGNPMGKEEVKLK